MVARLSGALQGVVEGAEVQPVPGEACAVCSRDEAGLHHLLVERPSLGAFRGELRARASEDALANGLLEWILSDTADVAELALKVEFVGRAAGARVRARGA